METATSIPLGQEDREILALEDATIAGHTCKVVWLDRGSPSPDALRERVADRIHLVPAFTRKLGGTARTPAWEQDPAFDIAEHVVEHRHEQPIDRGRLVRCVARLFEQRLDRSRPLWRIDVVSLADDHRALVWRIHHALADGATAVRYARLLLWDDALTERNPSAAHLAQKHDADERRRRAHLAGWLLREFRRSSDRSPFDGPIGTQREVGFAAVPLKPLHDAARVLGDATLNDAVLAVVAGALRRWLHSRHEHVGRIRVKVPVSLHREGDAEANHDSCFTLALPLDEPDPIRRLRAVHASTAERKAAGDAFERERLLHGLSDLSPGLEQFFERLERSPRRFALNVSNVPGPREPVSILGCRVRQLHTVAEISMHHALRVSVISFVDQLCFGFCADPHVIGDVQSLANLVEPEAIALLDAVSYR
jgi:hypothetical protein